MRKIILTTLLATLIAQFSWANMASPVEEGNLSSLPFTSQFVRILRETILMTPDADFKHCKFDIRYFIDADLEGLQIPMLFVADNYESSMQIWVDGKSVEFLNVVGNRATLGDSAFSGFTHVFEENSEGKLGEVTVYWDSKEGRVYRLDDLHYFQLDLAKGAHEIRVAYIADVWEDRTDLVLRTDFRYLLYPASFWKSFGKLQVILDQSQCPKDIETNLGPPNGKATKAQTQVWEFDALPNEMLTLGIKPKVSETAKILMQIGQRGFLRLSFAVFGLLHLLLMWRHRKKRPKKKFSWIWLVGSLLLPIIAIFFFLYSGEWIDSALGEFASKRADYSILIIFFYPFALIVYALFSFLVDFAFRKRYPV